MNPSLTVVTVAFGNDDVIADWALQWQSRGVKSIVCDNGGSLSGSLLSGVTVLGYEGNSGFGGGINRAVRAADSDLILVTNPDTLPTSESFLELFIEKHRKNSLSGGSTFDTSGRAVDSTGIWPSLRWIRKQILKPAESLFNPEKVDWLQGSLILVYREDFLQLGGFSETYPLYFEDVDLCARALKAGMEVLYEPSCKFIHDQGTGSSGSCSTRLSSYHWGLVEYFRNHRAEEYNEARNLVLLKCLLRSVVLAPFKPSASFGYMSGFRCVLGHTPPHLPGRSCG